MTPELEAALQIAEFHDGDPGGWGPEIAKQETMPGGIAELYPALKTLARAVRQQEKELKELRCQESTVMCRYEEQAKKAEARAEKATKILEVANRYNARHSDFTPCMEVDYFNSVIEFLASARAGEK